MASSQKPKPTDFWVSQTITVLANLILSACDVYYCFHLLLYVPVLTSCHRSGLGIFVDYWSASSYMPSLPSLLYTQFSTV